ncbi:polysaccharide biosynthesis/export family protein [soil metagenome]
MVHFSYRDLMKNIVWLLVALTCALPLTAQTSPAGTVALPAVRTSDPILKPGDLVQIAVWRQPEWSGEYDIAADGTIAHPLYRAVNVSGIPVSAAEDRVRVFLRRYEETPAFFMQARFRVAVGGEVREPKLYTLAPEVTIAQAVALAGGPTERGEMARVRLLRDGQETVLDLTSAELGVGRMPIRSGDQIIIPRRRDVFRDVIIPASSVAGAFVGLLNLILLAI